MNKLNGYPLATLGVAALLGSVMATVPAHAGGGDFIEEDGACSANASWIMKAKHDDGRIELEFSVDSNRAGQTWAVRVTDNERLVFAGEKVTNRLNQRFSVDRIVANRAGTGPAGRLGEERSHGRGLPRPGRHGCRRFRETPG